MTNFILKEGGEGEEEVCQFVSCQALIVIRLIVIASIVFFFEFVFRECIFVIAFSIAILICGIIIRINSFALILVLRLSVRTQLVKLNMSHF